MRIKENLSATAPSAESIEFSIEKLDEVIAKLEVFKGIEKYRNSTYQNALNRLIGKMNIAKDLHGYIPKFNEIKRRMDAAYKAEDAEGLRATLSEWNKLMFAFGMREKITYAKRKTTVGFKVSSPYVAKLINLLDTIVSVRDSASAAIKRLQQTPAQRSAADATSARMRRLWSATD